jgi:hypothetical protein
VQQLVHVRRHTEPVAKAGTELLKQRIAEDDVSMAVAANELTGSSDDIGVRKVIGGW